MPRPEKVQAVEEIKNRLESSEATFLAEYRGLSVKQQQALRRGLRDAGAEFKVVKMTLARRAAEQLGLDFGDDLSGPTALAFASSDPVPVAKALRDFGKENDAFVLKSGLFGGNVLAPEAVARLAELEPREVLLAKIAGAAKAPLYSLAGMLSSFNRNAASMFSQLLEKKENAAPTGDEGAETPVASPESAGDDAADAATDDEPEAVAEAEPATDATDADDAPTNADEAPTDGDDVQDSDENQPDSEADEPDAGPTAEDASGEEEE